MLDFCCFCCFCCCCCCHQRLSCALHNCQRRCHVGDCGECRSLVVRPAAIVFRLFPNLFRMCSFPTDEEVRMRQEAQGGFVLSRVQMRWGFVALSSSLRAFWQPFLLTMLTLHRLLHWSVDSFTHSLAHSFVLVLAESQCLNMRNCLKHACKRRCCDGKECPPCNKVCDEKLNCKNHKASHLPACLVIVFLFSGLILCFALLFVCIQ